MNCYAEPLGKDINTKKGMVPPAVVWRKSPGLTLFGASGQTGFRGGIASRKHALYGMVGQSFDLHIPGRRNASDWYSKRYGKGLLGA